MPSINDKAPGFSLPDTSKNRVSLEDYAGKKLVIAFYPAAFTGVCTTELCTFRDAMADFNGLNAEIVGISVDAPFSNGAFAKANDIEFPLLSDYARETVHAYGVALENFAGMDGYTASQRAVFIVNEEGSLSYVWIAPNPGVEPNYDEIRAHLG